jgi:hypothetical protein
MGFLQRQIVAGINPALINRISKLNVTIQSVQSMKNYLLLLGILFCSLLLRASIAEKVTVKDGNIYVQSDKGDLKQITFKGLDSDASLAHNRKFVIFLRTVKNTAKHEEGDAVIDETSILLYDLRNSTEKALVTGCKMDETGSSPFDYADSEKYPFKGLCNISNPRLSPDDKRVYFETTAWVVCNAVHYCLITSGKICFFHAGSLNDIQADGNVNINITDIQKNRGRYYQDWLFDQNGKAVKALGKKE